MSSRLVRSPEAPKMTRRHGSAGLADREGSVPVWRTRVSLGIGRLRGVWCERCQCMPRNGPAQEARPLGIPEVFGCL